MELELRVLATSCFSLGAFKTVKNQRSVRFTENFSGITISDEDFKATFFKKGFVTLVISKNIFNGVDIDIKHEMSMRLEKCGIPSDAVSKHAVTFAVFGVCALPETTVMLRNDTLPIENEEPKNMFTVWLKHGAKFIEARFFKVPVDVTDEMKKKMVEAVTALPLEAFFATH